jgi:hypothetical protein
MAAGVELLDVGQPATQPSVPGWDWSGDPDHAAMFAALTVLLAPPRITLPVLTLFPSGYLIIPGPGRASAGVAIAGAQALGAGVTGGGGARTVAAGVANAAASAANPAAVAAGLYTGTYTSTY